jgi:molybdopterin-dependent oxidoreductase alpha subunit
MGTSNTSRGKPRAETPLESKPPTLGPIPTVATGLTAAVKSLQVSVQHMGVAKTLESWKLVNQKGGFDCPSCAWADPEHDRSSLEFCENGAKAFADDATQKTIGTDFFSEHSLEALAEQSDQWLNAAGRLAEPMVFRQGDSHYRPISWPDAFELVAQELKACESPDDAVFYTSGKAVNESAFLFQLLARRFGTNNLPDCSNMCHESSGKALTEAIGAGKSTVTLEDLESASVILVVGQNPGTNHPRMLTSLQKAKERGAKIIAVNPLKEVGLLRFAHPQKPLQVLTGGTSLADEYLQLKINGDVALLRGLAKLLLENNALDEPFIRNQTHGFNEYRALVEATTWTEIEQSCGLAKHELSKAAKLLANSKGTVACWAMGLTQHENAVDNIRELTNLLLLGGHIGKPSAGLFCVRGHSNVQGDRTMGIAEKMPESFYAGLEREFDFVCPREPGFNTVETIEAMHSGKVKVFIALGGNFLSATPDTPIVADGFRKCSLTVSIATKLNRGHLITGKSALILPCLSRTELDQPASVENTVSFVSTTRGIFAPVSAQLKSEAAIIAGIGSATLQNSDWQPLAGDYSLLREKIARIVPGFEDFERKLQAGGFYAPVAPREGTFPTKTGKAQFGVSEIPRTELAADQLVMMTIRTHDQFNTVVYGEADRYRGISSGRRVILMNRVDMEQRGIGTLQKVTIHSHFRGEIRTMRHFRAVVYDIPRGNVATYFPEANPLIPLGQRARESRTPASKSVVVTVVAESE